MELKYMNETVENAVNSKRLAEKAEPHLTLDNCSSLPPKYECEKKLLKEETLQKSNIDSPPSYEQSLMLQLQYDNEENLENRQIEIKNRNVRTKTSMGCIIIVGIVFIICCALIIPFLVVKILHSHEDVDQGGLIVILTSTTPYKTHDDRSGAKGVTRAPSYTPTRSSTILVYITSTEGTNLPEERTQQVTTDDESVVVTTQWSSTADDISTDPTVTTQNEDMATPQESSTEDVQATEMTFIPYRQSDQSTAVYEGTSFQQETEESAEDEMTTKEMTTTGRPAELQSTSEVRIQYQSTAVYEKTSFQEETEESAEDGITTEEMTTTERAAKVQSTSESTVAKTTTTTTTTTATPTSTVVSVSPSETRVRTTIQPAFAARLPACETARKILSNAKWIGRLGTRERLVRQTWSEKMYLFQPNHFYSYALPNGQKGTKMFGPPSKIIIKGFGNDFKLYAEGQYKIVDISNYKTSFNGDPEDGREQVQVLEAGETMLETLYLKMEGKKGEEKMCS